MAHTIQPTAETRDSKSQPIDSGGSAFRTNRMRAMRSSLGGEYPAIAALYRDASAAQTLAHRVTPNPSTAKNTPSASTIRCLSMNTISAGRRQSVNLTEPETGDISDAQ